MGNKTCKFCGLPDGALGRNCKPVHINNQQLCGPCYTVIEKAKRTPEKMSERDVEWFNWMCEFNLKHGMFVPIKQRRELRAKQPWTCRRCGTADEIYRDDHYINYCRSCADELRRGRDLPTERRPRSDKGIPRKRAD